MTERPTSITSENPESEKYDVIIVGAGPAGASAAIYTARADLKTLVIDKGLTVGALGVTGKISNYPGVPGPLSGAELLSIIRQQAESFGAKFLTDRVAGADLGSDIKTIITNGGSYEAKSVVIATGAMGRAAVVDGEERLLGKGVSYCATCDGAFFRGRPVAVVGNNDEAMEEALFLTKFASRIELIVPTSSFKAGDSLVKEIENAPNIARHFNTRLSAVLGESGVTGIRVSPRQGPEFDIPVEGAFIYLQGNRPITDFLLGQLETTPQGCLKVDDHMQTSVPGVFAIGDLLCTHVKQAVIAAADGVVAAIEVEKHLNHRSKAKIDWG
jgi:thioredoxin reductase (NADPH)